jgi:hypothetical protein
MQVLGATDFRLHTLSTPRNVLHWRIEDTLPRIENVDLLGYVDPSCTVTIPPSRSSDQHITTADRIIESVIPRTPIPTLGVETLRLGGLGALPRDDPILYTISAMDDHGRLSDKQISTALAWKANQRLTMTTSQDSVTVRTDPDGVFQVPRRALVQIPAPIRQWLNLLPGDRLFLAALPRRQVLIVHTLTAVDAMMLHRHGLIPDATGT